MKTMTYDYLKEMIINNKIPASENLNERTIAKELADNGNIQINNDVHLVHIR